MTKFVYSFQEGNKDMRALLGGKGANLAEMTGIGLPVPRGFTVTTEACNKYYDDNKVIAEEVKEEIFSQLAELEKITEKKLGDTHNPLLVSVRSGSRASMPGMMDTVLNLGLNDEVAKGFAEVTKNPRFIYDSYRRFIMMFADVVKGYPKQSFDRILEDMKEAKGVKDDTELDANDMMEVTDKFKSVYKELSGVDFPQDPKEQLIEAVTAVFRSWNNERAIIYRRMNDIPSSWGTAVNVQEMVYGNRGDDCGTGVAFTRNPATGEHKLFGEYLINAQGEDVVAGIRTPQPIATLKEVMPEVYAEFEKIANILETHYKDMQDMEFTIENGKLFMLQTRNGKRTAQAALKVAVDMVNEGMITKEEALLKVEPKQLDQLLHPMFSEESLKNGKVIATGLAASPGAATGRIYFNAEDVSEHTKNGEDTILVRLETSPEDIQGMNDAKGVLTIRGGMTSHAAVVARGMGRCCVCGCGELVIDEDAKTIRDKEGNVYKEGDYISINGSTGAVYGEQLETVEPTISGDFETFMGWADSVRTLGVRANADTPKDALQARKFGAEGIGLVRTEHMFFEEERIFAVRQMITAETKEQREVALSKILPMQRNDFEQLFEAMEGMPVTIRYLDPPLHEFLPHTDEEIRPLAESLGMKFVDLKNRIESLKEFNPMMGHRGCRLAVTYPEIAEMQTRAVIEAAINVNARGMNVVPEIMIPLVGEEKELKYVKDIVCKTADEIIGDSGLKYKVGTMIEIPRAALTADKIAKEAEFFSFGTNDLTQMTYGFSRDDAGKFLNDYYDKGIFESDPFAKLDQTGVGKLVEMAANLGRQTRPDIKLGICGEHGGEPSSVEFCHRVGLNYVSCSPYRVPLARLAAAQAQVKYGNQK
ncbi:MAG TPA: pyruvate, phosphate dikinase [Candidatus Fimihabitans intestinipullorum]|uniref:Pyruvate, phosphate dikinase n=1 Tax=Candidatus Fimihabitans intestinipullorum TaxID=2840820 RepID=A0A9D1L406_9BACT|nr:pyruvate, phosphate dikinase [Candidatus Fimihabitans intestinipullorum]